MKKGFFDIQALSPDGRSRRTFYLAEVALEKLVSRGLAAKYFAAMLVPIVMAAPTAIFQGLKRPRHEESLCYVGVPACRYLDEKTTVPPPPGMVFLVFADKERRVFNWRWEKADLVRAGYPENYEERFDKRLWAQA